MKLSWKTRLKRAEVSKVFTTNDKVCAGSWDRCVVGEFRRANPKSKYYRGGQDYNRWYYTIDNRMFSLGYAFDDAVRYDNIEDASKIYNEIVEFMKP